MKRLNSGSFGVLLVAIALAFSSCGIENSAVGYDDIYADDAQIAFEEQNYVRQQDKNLYKDRNFSHQPKRYREQLSTSSYQDTVIGEDFDMDDYYDYAYTARLHRFHDPAPIYGYYDDYYTNLYWYDRDYLLFGTSIYYGYRWWWPSYSYYWGWGWHPWHHYGWYGNWWGWHHGWYDYAWGWGWYSGPHHGYWSHNPHYYNSHDRNSGFYRPEHEGGRLTRSNTRSNSTISRGQTDRTFGERYNQRFGNNAVTRGNSSSVGRQSTTSAQSTLTRNQNRLQKPVSRSSSNAVSRSNYRTNNSNSTVQRNNSTVNRNYNGTNRSNTATQSPQRRTYTPPMQRQQRSNTTMRNTTTNRSGNMNRSSNINSSRSRSMSSPSRSSSSSRGGSYSSPSRSSSSGSRGSSSSHSGGVSRGGGGRR